jgi:GNAT superfamily N-acetyltransferase
LAIVISDEWQGKGLGTKLLGNLLEKALKQNVPRPFKSLCDDSQFQAIQTRGKKWGGMGASLAP